MKKFLSVVLLAAMMTGVLVSCSGEETATTTVGKTDAPKVTTTQTAPVTEGTETDDPSQVTVLPKVAGDGLEELIAGLTRVSDEGGVDVDMESLASNGFNTWNAETENVAGLFDGVDTFDEWYYLEDGTTLKDGADPYAADGPTGGGPGKCGGGVSDPTFFFFALTDKATLGAYVMVTGNDNSKWNGRWPREWTLYATNDAAAYEAAVADVEAFDETQWATLDYVYDTLIAETDFTPNGYEVDEANRGAYQYYIWKMGYTSSGVFQATELDLYVVG